MNRVWIAAFCLVVSVVGSGLIAQQPPETVSVPVQVADRDGYPVAGLEQKDFIVLDNRVAQTIRTFAAGETEGTYLLTFLPAPNPSTAYRELEVRVARPNLRVRSRAGYIPAATSK